MICTPKSYFSLFGSYVFAGMAFGCLFVPLLGDKYGRWKIFIITMALHLLLYPALIFTDKIGMVYFLCFIFGLLMFGRYMIGFILVTELSHKKY